MGAETPSRGMLDNHQREQRGFIGKMHVARSHRCAPRMVEDADIDLQRAEREGADSTDTHFHTTPGMQRACSRVSRTCARCQLRLWTLSGFAGASFEREWIVRRTRGGRMVFVRMRNPPIR